MYLNYTQGYLDPEAKKKYKNTKVYEKNLLRKFTLGELNSTYSVSKIGWGRKNKNENVRAVPFKYELARILFIAHATTPDMHILYPHRSLKETTKYKPLIYRLHVLSKYE